MNKVLMTAVANLAAFLAAPHGSLDDDAATQQLEQLAASLRRLSAQDRAEFAQHIELMARAAKDEASAQALKEPPGGLGLLGETTRLDP